MKKIFLINALPFFVFSLFCNVDANAQKNVQPFPLYKQCANPIVVKSKTENIYPKADFGDITLIETKKQGEYFVHTLELYAPKEENMTIDFINPVMVMTSKGDDGMDKLKTFKTINPPMPALHATQEKNEISLKILPNNTFRNTLPDEAIYFTENVVLKGKDIQGKEKTIEIKNETKTSDFVIDIPKDFAKGQIISLEINKVNRMTQAQNFLPVEMPKHQKITQVKI